MSYWDPYYMQSPPPPTPQEVIAGYQLETAKAQSEAQVQTAQIQAGTMQLGILKNSQDAQFQTLAWMTERLDAHDTKLQVATIQAKADFAAASNHHVERMEELRLEGLEFKKTVAGKGAGSPDIPEPDFF